MKAIVDQFKKEIKLNQDMTRALDRELYGIPLSYHERTILLIDYKEIYGDDELSGNIEDDYKWILDI